MPAQPRRARPRAEQPRAEQPRAVQAAALVQLAWQAQRMAVAAVAARAAR